MLTYIVRRIGYSIPVLVVSSFLIFSFVSYVGDPLAALKMRPTVSAETIRQIEHEKHLDRPIPVRYLYWVRDATLHKFGKTLLGDRPVWNDLRRVMPHTFQLVLAAETMAILIAIGVGVYSAIRQYSAVDYVATTFSFLAFATPVFWLALILQIVFTDVYLHWHVRVFYTSGLNSADAGHGIHFVVDRIQHLGLPVFTLMVLSIALYTRYLRASLLDVIGSDYVRTARAKGLHEARVTMRHAFRNALIPLVTVIALNLSGLLSGAVVTETVFQLDGMGPYFIASLGAQDVYPVMAWLMVTSIVVIVFNLLADVALGLLDPRIRLG